jgi:ABC-2 type transport system permease protein
MAMVQAAYTNNASSVFQSRFDRYLNDVLASPMRNWEINLGLSLRGVVRALLIGVALLLMALPRSPTCRSTIRSCWWSPWRLD